MEQPLKKALVQGFIIQVFKNFIGTANCDKVRKDIVDFEFRDCWNLFLCDLLGRGIFVNSLRGLP